MLELISTADDVYDPLEPLGSVRVSPAYGVPDYGMWKDSACSSDALLGTRIFRTLVVHS